MEGKRQDETRKLKYKQKVMFYNKLPLLPLQNLSTNELIFILQQKSQGNCAIKLVASIRTLK